MSIILTLYSLSRNGWHFADYTFNGFCWMKTVVVWFHNNSAMVQKCLDVIWQKTLTWTKGEQYLWCHMALLGPHKFNLLIHQYLSLAFSVDFYPRPLMVLSLPASVRVCECTCPCVCFNPSLSTWWFITHSSQNTKFRQKIWNTLVKIPIVWGLIDLDSQGEIK